MSKNHAQAGGYRGAHEKSGAAKVCSYRHRIPDWGPCDGKIGPVQRDGLDSDHVDELQDAPWQDPETAWKVWACHHHHVCKTNEAKVKRRARREGRMVDTAPRLPKAPGGKKGATRAAPGKKSGGWGNRLVTAVALLILAGVGLSFWFNITDPMVGVASGALGWLPYLLVFVVPAACGRYGRRAYRWLMRKREQERADWLVAQAAGIARKMQCAPDAVSIEPRGRRAWTRDGLCMRGRVTYPAHVLDDDPKLRKAVEAHWRHKLGIPDLVIEWNVGRNWFDFRPPAATALPAPPEVPEMEPPPDAAAEHAETMDNLQESLRQRFKEDKITVEVVSSDADHSPTALRIFYGPKFADSKDSARLEFLAAVQAKTEARWRPDWRMPRNILMLARRPQMPPFVANPTCDIWRDGKAYRFPLGVGEHGERLYWDIYDAPHALIAGGTGSGKTILLQALIWWASIMGWDIVLIDPKGVGLGGLRDLPGVIRSALADPEEINDTLVWAEAMMRGRYRKVLKEGANYTDFRRCLIVVDEFADLVTLLRGWHRAKGERGDPAGLSAVTSIPRLGRECNVLEVIGIQQAAAGFFDGTEARDNFGLRVGLGPQSQQAADMLFGRVDAGRDVPQEAKGRATIALKQGQPQEMQVFWTPTIMPNGNVKPRHEEDDGPHPDDVAAIARLREVVASLPRQRASEAPEPEAPPVEPEPPDRTVRTRTTRARQATGPRRAPQPETVGLPFLDTCAITGQARWVKLEDGTPVRVDKVEPDESAEGYILVEGETRDGMFQALSFPEDWQFELADEQ